METENGKVSFNTFMNAIGMETIPGDVSGLSSIIALENERFLENRQLDHETRCTHSLFTVFNVLIKIANPVNWSETLFSKKPNVVFLNLNFY